MVFGNPFERDQSSPSKSSDFALASPQDRLAAVLIDALLLVPVFSLALAPLKRVFYAGQLLGEDFYYRFETLFAALIVMAVAVLYQGFFVYFKGATPGKRLLKIQVVSIWPGRRLTLMDSLVRAFAWCVECLFFMIPHAAVEVTHRRRPIHDRLADTIVVAVSGPGVREPSSFEVRWIRMLTHCFTVLLLLAFAISSGEVAEDHADLGECGPADDTIGPQALAKKLALFAVDNLPGRCLQQPADALLNQDSKNGLAYLAKAFATVEDELRSNAYLQEVCKADPGSESCHFSRVVSQWDQATWRDRTASLAQVSSAPPDFIRYWAARHLYKVREYQKVLDLLESTSIESDFASFTLGLRMKSLWKMGLQDSSRAVYQTHVQHLSGEEKLDVTSWLCHQELRGGCSGAERPSCRHFKALGETSQPRWTEAMTVVDLKLKTCADSSGLNLTPSYLAKLPQVMIEYADALRAAQVKKMDEARLQMAELSRGPEPTPVVLQARFDLIGWAAQAADLDDLLQEWREEDPFGPEWAEVGEALMQRLVELNSTEQAFLVGSLLFEFNWSHPQFLASFKSLSRKTHHLQQAARETASDRKPAGER